MSSVIQGTWLQIRKWKSTPRVYMVFLLTLICLQKYTYLGEYCIKRKTPISQWVYPFAFSFELSYFAIFLCFIILIADAPFMEDYQLFYFIRNRKCKWYATQVLYIAVASVLYFMMVQCILWIYLIPYMKFQSEWGSIIYNISMMRRISFFDVAPSVLENFTPFMALVHSLVLTMLTGFFLGLVIFDFNLLFKRGVGVVIAMFFSVGAKLVGDLVVKEIHYLSPLSWVNLGYYKDKQLGLPIWYPYVAYALLLTGLIILGYYLVKKRPFEVQEEM
ncbi:hypothetical protein P261_01433 [Lachnospiraceae bacterium TWA4]|nr:hypothetical protein P261_01433 [Lachnospiraceae bacterium TWA4]